MIKSTLNRPKELTARNIVGAIMFSTGKSVEQLANELNCSKVILYQTVNGKNKSRRGMISEITGLPVSELWPEPAEDGR